MAGYAAAVWGFVSAVPSFYWAMGGLAGAASTISPSLVKLAQDRNPGFVAVLWLTGVLKVVGGVVRGRRHRRHDRRTGPPQRGGGSPGRQNRGPARRLWRAGRVGHSPDSRGSAIPSESASGPTRPPEAYLRCRYQVVSRRRSQARDPSRALPAPAVRPSAAAGPPCRGRRRVAPRSAALHGSARAAG